MRDAWAHTDADGVQGWRANVSEGTGAGSRSRCDAMLAMSVYVELMQWFLGIKRNRWQTGTERRDWTVFHLLNICDSLVYLLSGTLLKSRLAYDYLFRHEGGSY